MSVKNLIEYVKGSGCISFKLDIDAIDSCCADGDTEYTSYIKINRRALLEFLDKAVDDE